MEPSVVDVLLERYLALLDEYTQCRSQLNTLQSGIYQNIARANFSAERGLRYGSDHYDERMQALRKLQVSSSPSSQGSPTFALGLDSDGAPPEEEKATGSEAADEDQDSEDETDSEPKEAAKPKTKNPLQWFGLLTPQPLRQAQGQAIRAVEECIPRLASLSAEMAEVEIEVRRARKKRAKAEAAGKKHITEKANEGVAV